MEPLARLWNTFGLIKCESVSSTRVPLRRRLGAAVFATVAHADTPLAQQAKATLITEHSTLAAQEIPILQQCGIVVVEWSAA